MRSISISFIMQVSAEIKKACRKETDMNKDYEMEMDLVKRAQAGEESAKLELLNRYEPLLRKLTMDEGDWEDMKEELIVVFLESLAVYDPALGQYFSCYIRSRLFWAKIGYIRAEGKRRDCEVHIEELGEEVEMEIEERRDPGKFLAGVAFDEKERELLRLMIARVSPKEIMEKCRMSRSQYYRIRGRMMEKIREKWKSA